MKDSQKQTLDSAAVIPCEETGFQRAILGGVFFLLMGIATTYCGGGWIGILTIVVGVTGVLAGAASKFWKSPRLKLLLAIDTLAMGFLCLGFTIDNFNEDMSGRTLRVGVLLLGGAVVLCWIGFDDLKKYRNLRKTVTPLPSTPQRT